MNKRASILIAVGLVITFAATAVVTGRPPVPLFDELPAGIASGLVAYERETCVYVADLQTAQNLLIRCSESERRDFQFYFTSDGDLQVSTYEDTVVADLVDPTTGELIRQVDTTKPPELPIPAEGDYSGWALGDHPEGKLLTVDGTEYVLPDAPSAYELHNLVAGESGDWIAFRDNLGQLVIVGADGGPWVADTELGEWGQIQWAPGS
jgi:hypothetical protein